MAKSLTGWLLLSGLALAAPPALQLKVWRQGSRVYTRITTRNHDRRWHGPFQLRLSARRAHFGPWLTLKTWKLPPLGPGHKSTREFFQEQSLLLRTLSATGSLQMRARVQGPGFEASSEETMYQPGSLKSSR